MLYSWFFGLSILVSVWLVVKCFVFVAVVIVVVIVLVISSLVCCGFSVCLFVCFSFFLSSFPSFICLFVFSDRPVLWCFGSTRNQLTQNTDGRINIGLKHSQCYL